VCSSDLGADVSRSSLIATSTDLTPQSSCIDCAGAFVPRRRFTHVSELRGSCCRCVCVCVFCIMHAVDTYLVQAKALIAWKELPRCEFSVALTEAERHLLNIMHQRRLADISNKQCLAAIKAVMSHKVSHRLVIGCRVWLWEVRSCWIGGETWSMHRRDPQQ